MATMDWAMLLRRRAATQPGWADRRLVVLNQHDLARGVAQARLDLLAKVELGHDIRDRRIVGQTTDHLDNHVFGSHIAHATALRTRHVALV